MEQRVAITGIGAVSPLGNTALATWAAMCAGTCGIGPITHFDTDAFAVKVAAEVKGFDGNEYFGKRDAKHLDPCVQFALAASDEAMHDAGFDVEGAIDRERLGVYVGSGVGGMQTLVDNVHTIADRGPRRASPYMIAMMIPNMASGNIAIRHKAKGPTLPVVTACATSAHAVGEAFRAIKHGYADAILAGGAEAAIIPDAVAGFTSCRALTTNPDPSTACRPFDADRDGFAMGEGACVLVLESMEHAQARGAHIYAEVVGYGNTDDAYHITSPDPEAAGIARAISLAVAEGDDNVHTIADRGPRRASPYMIAMMIPNMASGNIAIRHKAKGPTLPVVTACATSAHAVGEAFRAIKHGYADAILAGGAEAAIIPDAVAGFTSCRALTTNPDPSTACRPFDADRDGFAMGEGACVLVLESMEHAQARGAHIYAEVVGYGNTDDAYHITSPDPEAAGIARAISLAVAEGDVKPSEGLYINAHGTSTKLNDSSETAGIKRALGEDAARAAHVSSTKSMTGHMIGATGAIEVMACAMALEQGVVPPTINYHTPDPACDLDYTPNRAVRADLTWALSTNLGFGGHNAAIALRRYTRS